MFTIMKHTLHLSKSQNQTLLNSQKLEINANKNTLLTIFLGFVILRFQKTFDLTNNE